MSGPDWEMDVPWPTAGEQRIYDLAQPWAPGMPHHPAHPPYAFALTKAHGDVVYRGGVSASSELISLGGHVGTHVDALGHVARDGRIHGGEDVTEGQSYTEGLGRGSIESVRPFLARAHLVDAPRLFGRDPEPDDEVTDEHLAEWFAERGEPEPGSVVLVRTGWDVHWNDNATFLGSRDGTPGVALSGARWLTDREVAATGADTIAYEPVPAPGLPVHVHLLVEEGVHIMEALNLAELAGDEVWEFFFVAVPLRIRGGTGSPIRPLAVAPAGSDGR